MLAEEGQLWKGRGCVRSHVSEQATHDLQVNCATFDLFVSDRDMIIE